MLSIRQMRSSGQKHHEAPGLERAMRISHLMHPNPYTSNPSVRNEKPHALIPPSIGFYSKRESLGIRSLRPAVSNLTAQNPVFCLIREYEAPKKRDSELRRRGHEVVKAPD